MRPGLIVLSLAVFVTACERSEHDAQVGRNRALADIARACMVKAEVMIAKSCAFPGAPSDCTSQALAYESVICDCARERMSPDFTDQELRTIARVETIEAEMDEISARDQNADDDPHFQELAREHGEALSGGDREEGRRLFWASAEAGRACRTAHAE